MSDKKTVWDLEDGDKYFYICVNSEIDYALFNSADVGKFYAMTRDYGNMFLSRDDALIELQKRYVEAQLERFGGVPYRKCDHLTARQFNWVMEVYSYGIEVCYAWDISCIEDAIPFLFEKSDDVYHAIDQIGEKRLLAYFNNRLYQENEEQNG
jgi:hypothetical protein